MHIIRWVFCIIGLSPILLHARDFGVMGHAFAITEPSMLVYIHNKLQQMQGDGRWDKHKQFMKRRTAEYAYYPTPVKGIHNATTHRSWLYDPSITITKDIWNGDGVLIAKQGTVVNPFDYITMRQSLVFIDGNNDKQVSWALDLKGRTKIILVNGSAILLGQKLQQPIYFDQQGTLTKRFGILAVPAVVYQENKKLRIQEVVLHE